MQKNKQFGYWALKEPHNLGHSKIILSSCVIINFCVNLSACKGLLRHFVWWSSMWGVLWAPKSYTGCKWWNGVLLILWFKSVSTGSLIYKYLPLSLFSISFLIELKKKKKRIRLDWTFPEIIPGSRFLKNIKEQQGKGKTETGQEIRIREEMFLYNLHLQKTGNITTSLIFFWWETIQSHRSYEKAQSPVV